MNTLESVTPVQDSQNQTDLVDLDIKPVQSSNQFIEEKLIAAPRWLMRLANRIRIGFALFVLLSSLLGLVGCTAQDQFASWQLAKEVLPPAVLYEVIAEQTNTTESERQSLMSNAQAWVIPGNEGRLVLLNYQTPQLCGAKGCLYTGLWQKPENQGWETVFNTYLKPNLPNLISLFEAPINEPSYKERPLPCFQVNQLDNIDNTRLQQGVYCWLGSQYQLIRTTVQPTQIRR